MALWIKEHNIKVMDRRSMVSIGDIDIKSFIIPHDAASPVGYTVNSNGKQVSVATDFGTFTREIYDNIKLPKRATKGSAGDHKKRVCIYPGRIHRTYAPTEPYTVYEAIFRALWCGGAAPA